MLSFEEKQTIIESYTDLTKKEVSMKRLNYHYEKSLYDKTVVVHHLHPNGNGYIFVGDLKKYDSDAKGLVNIREASEAEIREMIEDSIAILSTEEVVEEVVEEVETIDQNWTNREGQSLQLVEEDTLWNVYHGSNLEESFGSFDEAEEYLLSEGFRPGK
ncbi:hypothetical protein [Paenisporosarcina cavernae]|uniref:Uncharacterized protein n=1 Tax=Paenisporosarcina cavernae TaxID=2320858 RepID=A0A385YXX1_9BACL|nr:hypothetical protein [Paenisporosarcina cavernae]AYC30448.1 hypothetical protein D3873_11625 [Paenisporosarcina cavernae]